MLYRKFHPLRGPIVDKWRSLIDCGAIMEDAGQSRAVSILDNFFTTIKAHQSVSGQTATLATVTVSPSAQSTITQEDETKVVDYTRRMAQENKRLLALQKGKPFKAVEALTAPKSVILPAVSKPDMVTESEQTHERPPIFGPGLYMYGSVGRGKTMLMGWLLEELRKGPVRVTRYHFFELMKDIHIRMATKGETLQSIGNSIADRTDIVLLDEVAITDVQDAAIFPSVMQILIKRNVAVVMTSNQHPQSLYLGGLNRHLFLPPLLEVLKEECRILNLNAEGTDIDWRSSGNSNDREWSWSTRFDQLSLSPVSISLSPTRSMTLTSCATGGLTTTCTYLTESDLFTDADYLTLAKYLHAKNLGLVLDVCGVAPFKSSDILGRARRFGKLIEVLYDAKVKLEILTEKDHPSELFVSLSYSNKEEEDKKQARASPLAHSAIDEAEKSINRCISRLRQLVTI